MWANFVCSLASDQLSEAVETSAALLVRYTSVYLHSLFKSSVLSHKLIKSLGARHLLFLFLFLVGGWSC